MLAQPPPQLDAQADTSKASALPITATRCALDLRKQIWTCVSLKQEGLGKDIPMITAKVDLEAFQ